MLTLFLYTNQLVMMELNEFQDVMEKLCTKTNGKYLSLHRAPASAMRFKQKVCDNVPALAVDALFIRAPELVCNTGSDNAVNVGVVKSAAPHVGIVTVKSFLVPARILYFP